MLIKFENYKPLSIIISINNYTNNTKKKLGIIIPQNCTTISLIFGILIVFEFD